MSFLDPDDVTALVDTTLTGSQLGVVIDREEAELAALIGPLTGDRTEVFLLTTNMSADRLTLRRTTDGVDVTDNGATVDAADLRLLADQRTLMRYVTATGNPYRRGYWLGPVEVSYEPNDADRVARVLIELISLGIAASSATGELAGETIGSYSYVKARTALASMTPEQHRRALVRTLLPRQLATSVPIRSSIIGRHALLGTVRPA